MKQETLEEAAERFYPLSKGGSMWMPSADDCNKANKQEGFIEGAKWQQERMYSEEDMINFSEWVSIQYPNQRRFLTTNDKRGFYTTKELLGKWFEQFKKK
jgi:hypothetical protein